MKLIKILRELKTTNKPIFGSGMSGANVYNVGKDKVVKYRDGGLSPDDLRFYKLFNKYPDVFPHVYKLTKDYVVMDKLKEDKELFELYKYFADKVEWDKDKLKDIEWGELEDPLTAAYYAVRNKGNYRNEFEIIKKYLKSNGEIGYYNTLIKCYKFCDKVNSIMNGEFIDMHMGNVGLDSQNNLKIFDISVDV